MNFEVIDMDLWSRKDTYQHFSTVAKSTYSLTVKVDVTQLVHMVKRNNLRFYPMFTWIVTSALNEFKQFRMGYNAEGKLGYYSQINPMYSVMDAEENVVSLCTEYAEDEKVFYKRMVEDMEEFAEKGKETDFCPNFYIVSTLPWLPYETFTVQNESDQHFLFPMVTWGKYEQDHDQYKMPLSLQISHAVADGYHCAQFYNKVGDLLSKIQ